jgi:hypothetical protein
MEIFTPKKISSKIATFGVEVRRCSKCNKDMVSDSCPSFGFETSTFPTWNQNDFKAQAARGGFVIMSNIKVDDNYICTTCEENGLADFLCAMCKERKPTTKQQESFGDPQEYLCSDCYGKVPAKKWDEKVDDLLKAHRYDFH